MSNTTTPTPITDKNGKKTTVHKRVTPKPTSDRVASVSIPVDDGFDRNELTAEYIGNFRLTSPDHLRVEVDYALLSAMSDDISYKRDVFIGQEQLNAIGKSVVGDRFELDYNIDSPNRKVDISLGEYKQILEAIISSPADENLYTPTEAYNNARSAFFKPASEGGWVPEADDSFDAGWNRGVEYGKQQGLISDVAPTGRGRKDITWEQKAIAAAQMDAGAAAYKMGIATLEPSGDIRRDWHEITGSQLVGSVGNWLSQNRHPVSDRHLGRLFKEFLGDEWSDDLPALEKSRFERHLVNVRDLRELFGEIAVSKGL